MRIYFSILKRVSFCKPGFFFKRGSIFYLQLFYFSCKRSIEKIKVVVLKNGVIFLAKSIYRNKVLLHTVIVDFYSPSYMLCKTKLNILQIHKTSTYIKIYKHGDEKK